MTCSRDLTYQNVLGALRARPNDKERMGTLASVLVELFGDDAERGVCDLAVALPILRDEEAFDPTIYSKVHDAIWPEVSSSEAFLTYVLAYGAANILDGASIHEVEAVATHALCWAIIERSDEVPDAAQAIAMAFDIMADEAARHHPEEH